jgi:hypothetical protein
MAPGPETSGEIELRRLAWVGPLTVAASVIAVWIVQRISLAILPSSLPRFSGSVLNSNEPAIVTAVLVTSAVLTFPVIADSSTNPLPSFRRLALCVLIVSCVPNLLAVVSRRDLGMLALMVLHVVAWAVTVTMLTRLMTSATISASH